METPKRLAKRLREFYYTIIRRDQKRRTRCVLVHALTADADGRVVIRTMCLEHDAVWRDWVEYIVETDAFETYPVSVVGQQDPYRCPIERESYQERPSEEAQAEPEPPEKVRDACDDFEDAMDLESFGPTQQE